ncbi:MAG: type II toxin-antitoxin system RelE/ParE family toxin [Hyphomonadaceae bacterium]|jgi:toxin ParE1/3/4|nr:type II toxin-antitoxin system RelE/ParE family toxin [Hyphomonadaceae bacterium]
MSRYVLSPRAQRDLDEIWDYTADRWGADQAESYIRLLQRAIETVAEDPRRGRPWDVVRPGYLKYPASSHMLLYRRLRSAVGIVRILHGRMDFEQHL